MGNSPSWVIVESPPQDDGLVLVVDICDPSSVALMRFMCGGWYTEIGDRRFQVDDPPGSAVWTRFPQIIQIQVSESEARGEVSDE